MIRRLAVGLIPVLISLAVLTPAASAAATQPDGRAGGAVVRVTGNCSSIGTYDDGLSDSQGLLLTEKNGSLGPRCRGTTSGRRGGCPAEGRATAAALSTSHVRPRVTAPRSGATPTHTGIDHGLLLHEGNGPGRAALRHSSRPTPWPRASPRTGSPMTWVCQRSSCSSVGNCVAVGNYETNAEVWEALILTETHGKWGRGVRGAAAGRRTRRRPERGAAVGHLHASGQLRSHRQLR